VPSLYAELSPFATMLFIKVGSNVSFTALTKKVALDSKLSDGLAKLGFLTLEHLLPSPQLFFPAVLVEDAARVPRKFTAPVAKHVRVKAVLGGKLAQLLVAPEQLKRQLALELRYYRLSLPFYRVPPLAFIL